VAEAGALPCGQWVGSAGITHQQRPVGFGDAGGHEPVGRECAMGASIAVPEKTVVRADLDPDDSPVGDRMS